MCLVAQIMPRRVYNNSDKASVLVVLKTNGGNIARTARDTGLPEATIRDWKKSWEMDGIPEALVGEVQEQADDILADMERVRYKALQLLEAQLPHEKSVRNLATVFGIMSDKINLARGLATSRSETIHELPAPEKMAEMFKAIVSGALSAADQREQDIKDVVIEQAPKALNR